jgi:predicted Fe-S protein YdhL (DUF1289 family)
MRDSPCVEVCQFDGKTGLCLGCLRTRTECREWRKMTPFRRLEIVRERPRRQTTLLKRTKETAARDTRSEPS